MNVLYIDPGNPLVDKVVALAFPNYKGRKIKIVYEHYSMSLRSYWSGGHRDYYKLVKLDGMEVRGVPSTHPFFDQQIEGIDNVTVPEGYVVVQHTLSGTQDLGITIHVPGPASLLPAGSDRVELTSTEQTVLSIIGGIVSSYRQQEYQRHGINASQVEAAKQSLIGKGLLNSRGAITTAGKNVRANQCKPVR